MLQLTHDGAIDIAIGKSRKDTAWKNQSIQWADLLHRISETTKTFETHNEYIAYPKARQDEIKDVGGFIGGYLNKGRRKKGSVLHRQLLTLDLDHLNGKKDILGLLDIQYSCAAAIYSTHKHTPEAPRLRLLIPLDREVAADEYVAIARRMAGVIGINYFDDTTFEPSRLMYWPSTSKDAEYVFQYTDGEWLSADEILSSYHDWRDSSEWPFSDRYSAVIQRDIKKQGDPHEKKGVIGAFCRTYTIDEAIETFLSDAYDTCDIPGRYTYKHGSTAAGLVVYEDKFAFSHHGTDPTSGKLCNAFDLVRLHLYGLQDDDVKEGTPAHKYPSFLAMEQFCTSLKEVKETLGRERMEAARDDFEGFENIDIDQISEWGRGLDYDAKGNLRKTHGNFKLILENDPLLKGKFAYDEFANRLVVTGDLPWRKYSETRKLWSDVDAAELRGYLSGVYSLTGKELLNDAFLAAIYQYSVHPVKNYLGSLSWDGVQRVDKLFIDYLGAEDSEYVRTVTRKALVAAVARVHEPGIKYETMLTLIGAEGRQKSTILRKLGVLWFSDSFSFHQISRGKEAFEVLQGYWIIEVGEMTGMSKAEVNGVKSFISSPKDVYRVPHAAYTSEFLRQCVFFGTTNEWDFLRGHNGNRRFWPVVIDVQPPIKEPSKDLTPDEVAQVWAEAVQIYHNGETLHLPPDVELSAKIIQKGHTEADERVGMIQTYLDTLLPESWPDKTVSARASWLKYRPDETEVAEKGTVLRERVSVAEIWCELFGGQLTNMTTVNTKQLHDIMRRMEGWEAAGTQKRFGPYGKQRGYMRKAGNIPLEIMLNTNNVDEDAAL